MDEMESCEQAHYTLQARYTANLGVTVSYNSSLSRLPHGPLLMTPFCPAFLTQHKDFMGAKMSSTVSFHEFYGISGFHQQFTFSEFFND